MSTVYESIVVRNIFLYYKSITRPLRKAKTFIPLYENNRIPVEVNRNFRRAMGLDLIKVNHANQLVDIWQK